jgi:5-methylcytosine-specific restriction endonuclease McrA
MNACCICHVHGPTDGNLIDGAVFHQQCYIHLKETADRLSRAENILLGELRGPLSFGEQVAMFFSESRRLNVLHHKQSLATRVQETRAEILSTKTALLQIYNVWPGYPPDWDQRRLLVRNRDKSCCAECGVSNMLQLHHRRAIREGGTHHLDNLVLLCAFCHSEAHGGKELKYKGPQSVYDDSPNRIERKLALINAALAEKKDVHFRYRKPDGTVTSRRVTPRELRKLTVSELQSLIGRYAKIEREGRLCLFGYCHLRQAKRTFAMDRIYKLRLS